MTMEPAELLRRIATTLRGDIAPAVDEEFPKTQTFMAAVVLQRLANQAEFGARHTEAERADVAELAAELGPLLAEAPTAVKQAADQLAASSEIGSLTSLIEALYAWGIDTPAAHDALAATRRALRRDIDRRMEIAT